MWTCVQGVCTWVRDSPGVVPDWSCAASLFDSPCGRVSSGGWALAVAAALLNGSFAALFKARRVQQAQVPAHVFAAWASLGLVLCFLPLVWLVGFRCLGGATFLSGALLALCAPCVFAAVQLLGLSQAAAIWCGAAVLVSYAAGAPRGGGGGVVPPPGAAAPLYVPLAAAACVALGAAGAAASGALQRREEAGASARRARVSGVGSSRWRRWAPEELRSTDDAIAEDPEAEVAAAAATSDPGVGGGGQQQQAEDAQRADALRAPLLGAAPGGAAARHSDAFRRAHGAAIAVVAGGLAGAVLAPMDFAPYECRGLPWLPAMGVGVAAVAPAALWLLHLLTTRKSSPRPPLRLAPAAAAGAGLASGALWGAAAAASALAAQALGLGAAYPITQAGLLVAGLWGVLLFSEITYLLPQLLFWLSALLLVAGAALLAAPPGRGA